MDTPYELRIDARRRTVANAAASLADFETTPLAPVEAQSLVQNPHVNLYCLDAASSQAILVEVAPDVSLAAAPFVYHAQYEGAQRLFAMPTSQLLELSESLDTKLDRLILAFNISRCGSTLLHQALNQVPGVASFSEPDGFIPYWSQTNPLPTGEAIALMRASASFLFRPQAFPHLAVPAIKFRGRNLALLKLCHVAFPQATLLFLYRDAVTWSASLARVGQRLGRDAIPDKKPLEEAIAFLTGHLGPISMDDMGLGDFSGPLSETQWRTLLWLALMDCHLRQAQEGLPITALSYADLNHRRQETLSRLFAICGLPLDAVQPALAAYERDSQAGTVMGRAEESQGNATRLTAEQEEEIRALVSHHPIIRTPDFIAPGTITLPAP